MTVGDRYPLTIFGRLLTCRSCGCHVDLIELPWPWIDGESYQCGECLRPALVRVPLPEPPAPPARRDMSTYDPRTEPIPF